MKKHFNKSIRFIAWTAILVLAFVFLFEVVYRLLPKSYFGLDYNDMYSKTGLNEGGFLKPNRDKLVLGGNGKKVRWITNSKGFRNTKEFSKKKPSNTFRILSLGDSFTAGARIDQSKTFSFLLEQQLNNNQDSINYEVIIVDIEDPVKGLAYLNKYGFLYEPDIVLLGVTLGNDLTQTFIHLDENGGFHLEDNKLTKSSGYSKAKLSVLLAEKLPEAACSYSHELDDLFEKLISIKILKAMLNITSDGESIFSSRGKAYPFLHDLSHGLGLFLKASPGSIKTTYQEFERVLAAYKNESNNHHAELLVCLFPQRFQINPSDWKHTIKDYDLDETYFDLNVPNNRIKTSCNSKNIELIDPTSYLQNEFLKDKESFYFSMGDMHWNERGNEKISTFIYNHLTSN